MKPFRIWMILFGLASLVNMEMAVGRVWKIVCTGRDLARDIRFSAILHSVLNRDVLKVCLQQGHSIATQHSKQQQPSFSSFPLSSSSRHRLHSLHARVTIRANAKHVRLTGCIRRLLLPKSIKRRLRHHKARSIGIF